MFVCVCIVYFLVYVIHFILGMPGVLGASGTLTFTPVRSHPTVFSDCTYSILVYYRRISTFRLICCEIGFNEHLLNIHNSVCILKCKYIASGMTDMWCLMHTHTHEPQRASKLRM